MVLEGSGFGDSINDMFDCTPRECDDYGPDVVRVVFIALFLVLVPFIIFRTTKTHRRLRLVLLTLDLILFLSVWYFFSSIIGINLLTFY